MLQYGFSKTMKPIKKAITAIAMLAVAGGGAIAGDSGKVVVDGSTTVGPVAKAFAEYYMKNHPGVNITVSESGSGNGAKSLINAACDVAMMSRPMKDLEKKAAQDAGVQPVEHIAAMDGIAVIVHPSNPIADLTEEQIRDIYTGKLKNWKELGGPDRPIVAISRDTNSGTHETFEALVLNGEKIAAGVEYVGSNGAIRQRIMSTPAAIGYVGLAFTEGVKTLLVNGVEVSTETVASSEYPITRPLYLFTNGEPAAGTPLAGFLNLSGTPEGKRIIEDMGFVPVK